MLLNRQRTLLTVVATLGFAATLVITALAAREVRSKTVQIAMAQETVRAVTNFRYLTMEVALYGEARAQKQWSVRYASFRQTLAGHQYSGTVENQLLAREKANMATLDRLFQRIELDPEGGSEARRKKNGAIVSALFLTAQDMLDDGFELMRLNRIELEAAQQRATVSAIASLGLMVLLIAIASLIIKLRVLQPVAALQRMTEQVMQGRLDVRLNLQETNEIGILGQSFDAMTGQLQQTRQDTLHENAERRRTQAELERSVAELAQRSDELGRAQKALQNFIDYTPALVVYWDKALRNRFANGAYQAWFGKSPQEIQGRHISEVLGQKRYEVVADKLRSALAGNSEVFEQQVRLHTGEMRDALLSYIPDIQNGEVCGLYGFVSDITSLKRAEAGQAAALQKLQGVVNAASDFAIIQSAPDGIIELFSTGAERMLGYSAQEVVGKITPMPFHLPAEVQARALLLADTLGQAVDDYDVFVAGARQGGSESHDWTYVRKDGTTLPVNLTVTAMRDEQLAIVGYLGIAKDIRAEREVRRVLASARDQAEQANVAKSQFLANMSHEIRTPMTAVLGMLELLQHTELSPLQRDYAGKSDSAARSLLGLLNDILDFSQVEAGKLELERAPFRIDSMMRDLSAMLSSLLGKKEVELIFAIAPDLPATVIGDAARLRQVLINLASNAIKFTERGEITVTLALAASTPDGDQITFAVEDSGIGIAQDKLVSIFDGFTQAEASTSRRFGGTGLGLTISQRLVALMGGTLTVESEPGRGSRFAFSANFPRPAPMHAEGSKSVLADAAPQPDLNVLVVDDNELSRASLVAMAASFGWHVVDAASGEEALAVLEAGIAFDVVLVDWRMPRMDGWDLARRIRAENAIPIVVMVTAHSRGALAERPRHERALLNGFLTKPVTPSMLVEAVAGARQGEDVDNPLAVARDEVPVCLTGLTLLVVDDNPMNQQIARGLLTHAGAEVDVAGGGLAALSMAGLHSYDAVLMDVQMPDMDGYQCTGALRRLPAYASTPIIAMTANVMASDREACIAAGMDDHIGKPIDTFTLVNVILKHCGAPAGAADRIASPAAQVQDARVDELKPAAHSSAASNAVASGGAIALEQALARMGGNKELFVALASTYVPEATQFVVQLRDALALPGYEGAANILHTFKSAAGIVGATQLHDYASGLESLLRKGEAIDPSSALKAVQLLVDASVAELVPAVAGVAADIAPVPSASSTQAGSLADALEQLDALLISHNMAAFDAYAALERGAGNTLGTRLAVLHDCMQRMDFKTASSECRNLLRECA